MQIPMGPGVRVMPETPQNRVITPDPSNLSRGVQAVTGVVQQVAVEVMEKEKKENDALARVKAGNAVIDRESQIKSITMSLDEQMRTGQLSYEKSDEAYSTAVNKLPPLELPGLDEAQQGEVGNSLKRIQNSGLGQIRQSAAKGRIFSAQSDLTARMDMLGKNAAMPGADVNMLNARMDAEDIDVAGRLAWGEQWASKKQEFKDNNWSTQATGRMIGAGNNLGSLQQLEHDLTAEDGFYANKLDPEKRNQLLNSVTGKAFQVKEHNLRQAEMREMKAMRVLDQMDKQAASGIPPSPAEQQGWKSALAGTSFAGEYETRVGQMVEVQQVLRLPIPDQQTFIQERRQQYAMGGATLQQVSNLDRLDKAVTSNIQQLRDQPLEWNAIRTGAPVDPLDFSDMTSREGQMTLVGQLGGRFDTLNAMRRQVGLEVNRNPFLPQEQALLKAAIAQADDDTKLKLFGAIAASAPSGSDYSETLKSLTADQPINLLAGMAQYQSLKGDDGTNVPQMLLVGQKILSDKSTPMPPDARFREKFDKAVGAALVPGTPQREHAYLAYKSLYAGMSSPKGVTHDGASPEVNSALSEKAINMATGGITEHAGAKVVKPYGMPDTTFENNISAELEGAALRTEIPLDMLEDLPLLPVPGKDGSYYLMNAGRIQMDPKTNQAVIVNSTVQAAPKEPELMTRGLR